MKHKFISSFAVPGLLILATILSSIVLKNSWNLELSSYIIFLFILLYIFVLERIIPMKSEWKSTKYQIWTDIKHFIFSAAIFDALGKMLALSLVLYLSETMIPTLNYWSSLPFIATYIIANLIGEFIPYWYHRISHVGDTSSMISIWLWKVHSIHHLPNKMNWLKTHWIHPINMFFNTFFKMTPILVLGFSEQIIFLVGITHVVVAYISHANIQTQKSFLDYLIVTPQLHHFHHSKKMEEAKNFGNTLPFWDLIFGTYFNRKGTVEEVGVVESDKLEYPGMTRFLKQIMHPFRLSENCCR